MDLTDIIYSNDYINILIQNYVAQSERYQMLFPESSALLTLNPQYSVLFLERSLLPENLFGAVPFTGLPKLFTPLSTLSLEVSGIVQTQNLYGGGYTGKNVIFGFLDTGIDYRHPAFLHANGQSRILAVWDQTDRTGTPPAQFPYGSLYTKSDLDAALESGDPLSLVPVTDPDGHGTYVAGVAGGTPDASAGFLGAAPEADFAVVKLKPAKQNLKDFYLVSSNAPVFEEDDLLSAMHFLNETAAAEGKPLVLCLALGTNQGSHSGTLPVSLTLARYGNTPGVIPVCATGNEGNAAHHYYGSVSETYTPKNVEFLVSEGNRGFTLELWGQAPQLFSVGFRSPGGETIPRIPVSLNQEQRITFVLERTVIYVNYEVVQATTGSQLILIRMLDPTPGIWTLQVCRAFPSPPDFHIWLPITGFSTSDVTFLEPDPYTASIFARSYISRVLSFLTTIRGIVSSFSYVVKRFPQVSHCLRRLIELLSSAGRESITFVSAALQNGHFNRSSPFLVLLICPRQVFITYHTYYNIAGSALLQAEVFRYSFFILSFLSLLSASPE